MRARSLSFWFCSLLAVGAGGCHDAETRNMEAECEVQDFVLYVPADGVYPEPSDDT
jgi:hypothetical protein